MEITSASSQSHTGLGGNSSLFPWTEEGEGLRGDEIGYELMFDVNADLEVDDKVGPGLATLRSSNCRPRFPPS